MRIRYFAWVRERIGLEEEHVDVPSGVETIADLTAWLVARGEPYATAFEHAHIVRAAIDQVHAQPGSSIAGAQEIAFFPPMTGG